MAAARPAGSAITGAVTLLMPKIAPHFRCAASLTPKRRHKALRAPGAVAHNEIALTIRPAVLKLSDLTVTVPGWTCVQCSPSRRRGAVGSVH